MPGASMTEEFDGGDRLMLALIAAAAAMMAVPLWSAELPAMPDYPAHLASIYLIAGGAHGPALSHFYFIRWAAIPNLAFEALVPALGMLTGIFAATRLLLALALVLWVIGPALVHRALYGRVGLAPLASVFFAYNDNFMWGFFNYYLAAGLALVMFALWIASAGWRPRVRGGVFAGVVLAIYFCHVFGAALLLLLIGCYELAEAAKPGAHRLRDLVAHLSLPVLIAVPSAIAFLFFKPGGGDTHVAFNLGDTFRDRIESALALTFDHPGYVALSLLVLLLLLGLWRGWFHIHPRMKLTLAVLVLLVFVVPEEAMGGWGVDLRLPAVLGALAFASLRTDLPIVWCRVLGGAAIVAVAFNAAALAGNWRYYDAQFREFRAATASLPRGVKLVTVLDGDAIGKAADQPYWHMAEFAVIDRGGFTPLLFTTRGQHVVQLQPGFQRIAASSARQGSPPDITELDDLAAGSVDGDWDIAHVFPYLMHFQCNYDEAVVVHLNGRRSPVPDMLKLRHAGSFFALYDIERQGCSPR